MLEAYGRIFLFFIAGLSFGVVNLFVASLVRFEGNDAKQSMPYECGMEPQGSPYVNTDIRFYLFALLFVLFDVEVLFIFPWAIIFRSAGWPGFLSMISFMSILMLALVYAWKRGGLQWGVLRGNHSR